MNFTYLVFKSHFRLLPAYVRQNLSEILPGEHCGITRSIKSHAQLMCCNNCMLILLCAGYDTA